MKKKMILKIAWVCITCLAVLASCVRMESNVMRVYAEDATEPTTESFENDDGWNGYLSLLSAAVGKMASVPTTVNTVLLAIQFAIAETQPIATAGDVYVYDGVTSVMCDYMYDDASYHITHIGGNRRTNFADAIYQYNILTYPSGSSAYYTFTNNGSVYVDIQRTGLRCIGAGYSQAGYTEPNAIFVGSNKLPFHIYLGGGSPSACVKKYTDNSLNSGVLCSAFGGVFGWDELNDFNNVLGSNSNYFVLPEVSGSADANEYLSKVYQKFEEEYGVEFEYSFPDAVPVGTLMPDGTIKEEPERTTDESGNIIVNVDVEFPTHLVPDVPEPDTYDYSQIQRVEIPLADEGLIKSTWISGFSTLIDSMVYTMDAFHLRELVLLLCVVGIFVYLIVRW